MNKVFFLWHSNSSIVLLKKISTFSSQWVRNLAILLLSGTKQSHWVTSDTMIFLSYSVVLLHMSGGENHTIVKEVEIKITLWNVVITCLLWRSKIPNYKYMSYMWLYQKLTFVIYHWLSKYLNPSEISKNSVQRKNYNGYLCCKILWVFI